MVEIVGRCDKVDEAIERGGEETVFVGEGGEGCDGWFYVDGAGFGREFGGWDVVRVSLSYLYLLCFRLRNFFFPSW